MSTEASDLDTETPIGSTSPRVPLRDLKTPEATPAVDDMMRGLVATRLLWLMVGIVIVAFIVLITITAFEWRATGYNLQEDLAEKDAKRLMDLMNLVFGPVVTLVSSVVGFYFGARTAKEAVAASNAQTNRNTMPGTVISPEPV